MPVKTNTLDALLSKISNLAKMDKTFNRRLNIEMRNIVSDVTNSANSIANAKGYCMTFITPKNEFLNKIPKLMGLGLEEIKRGVEDAWQQPTSAKVKGHPYTLALSLIYAYAAKISDEKLGSYALQLLLFRNWNGQHKKSWPLNCNTEIMAYVIANVPSKQFTVSRYPNPLLLIEKHLTPTIMKKYFVATQKNPLVSKSVNEQSWSRVGALFRRDFAVNLKTNRSNARSGLAPWYYAAADNGKRIQLATSRGEDSGIEDFTSVHSSAEITRDVTRLIISTFDPTYDKQFMHMISRETRGVKQNIVHILLNSFYGHKYRDLIEDMVSLILSRMQPNMDKVCTDEYYPLIKRLIISSKHNMTVTKIKVDLADRIISDIFDSRYPDSLPYERWSLPRKASYRAVLIYAVSYTIHQIICSTKN